MKESGANVLLIGYGNPGRQDDGLGPAVASAMEKLSLTGVTVDANYQLTVEDAEAVSRHRVVIFADADARGSEPFSFRAIHPRAGLSFSSHSLEPAAVLAMARELFGAEPEGYLLGIRGYRFDELNESLTEKAKTNLALALAFLQSAFKKNSFRQAADFSPRAGGGSKEEK